MYGASRQQQLHAAHAAAAVTVTAVIMVLLPALVLSAVAATGLTGLKLHTLPGDLAGEHGDVRVWTDFLSREELTVMRGVAAKQLSLPGGKSRAPGTAKRSRLMARHWEDDVAGAVFSTVRARIADLVGLDPHPDEHVYFSEQSLDPGEWDLSSSLRCLS
eukprot:SAG22_NODE_161_length_16908_cov_39.687965_4_plen_160_part_00